MSGEEAFRPPLFLLTDGPKTGAVGQEATGLLAATYLRPIHASPWAGLVHALK
jgi:hypothetical protein